MIRNIIYQPNRRQRGHFLLPSLPRGAERAALLQDLSDPLLVMFEQPEGEGEQEENTFEVTEGTPDVELFNYKTNTRSIHVVSGA